MSSEHEKKGVLILSDLKGSYFEPYKNYAEMCRHFAHLERLKLTIDYAESGNPAWSFLFLSSQNIVELIRFLKTRHDEKILLKAYREQLPVIEICKGDYHTIKQIPVTRDTDTEKL